MKGSNSLYAFNERILLTGKAEKQHETKCSQIRNNNAIFLSSF